MKINRLFHIFSIIFLFLAFHGSVKAQNENPAAQEPIKKIEAPNGSPVIIVQIVHGYLVGVTDEKLVLRVNGFEMEVLIRDIRLAYKYYDKNAINHHKTAGIGAGIAGGGVVAVEVMDKEEINKKEFFKDAGIASAAGYVMVYLGSWLFEDLKKRGEIPDKALLYNAKTAGEDGEKDLAKKFERLEEGSFLELVLK